MGGLRGQTLTTQEGYKMTEAKKNGTAVREDGAEKDDLSRFITAYNRQYQAGPCVKKRKETS